MATSKPRLGNRLSRCERGSTLVEFAFIGPVVIGLMLAVLQVGFALQSYNALRSATADAARFAVVQYQAGNAPTDAQIETEAVRIATSSPYLLRSDQLILNVDEKATQSIDGAIEMSISASYETQMILPFFNWTPPTLTYERPIFVLDPAA